MTKDVRLNLWKPNMSIKPARKFVKCSHLNLTPCLLSTKLFGVICRRASTFIICLPQQTFVVFCLFANVNTDKNHYFKVPAPD